ncbi:MAG: serine/threonine-protein kinase [Acidobacteriota bacterium]
MERIGKYEVLDQIGSGGFATVYKGYDPFIKRPVAIKVCNSREEESRQRFYREAEIVGSLQHRNITAVYDFGVHDDQPYLVEEYLPGEDLAHMVRRQEPSDLGQRLDFLVQIASGLEFAHQQGVIHRDIKPSNVRVLGDGRIKIMDFGTAKLAHVESNLTQAGMTLGTVAYLSPERLLGNPSGTNSDIFSYGVLAYEVLSFRRPFAGRNIPNLIDQVLNAAPTPLADNWPECPPKLAEVVHRCLFKDPTVRYASCGDVLQDLEQVIVDNTGRVPVGLLNEPTGSLSMQQTTVQVSGLIERARSLIKSGRHSRAELMLEEVLEIAPKNVEARQLIALCREVAEGDGSTSAGSTGSATTTPPPATGPSYAGPDGRRDQKRAEAVASIARYIQQGELLSAVEALRFAGKLLGPLDETIALRRRLLDRSRQELAAVKGEAARCSRSILDRMIQLRQAGDLDLETAEQLTARVLAFDPEDLAARDLLELVRSEPPPGPSSAAPPPPPTAEGPTDRDRKLTEAVTSIEALLSRGQAETASQALEFAVGLFGEFDAAEDLRQRIAAELGPGA